jgi:hypothetical protein
MYLLTRSIKKSRPIKNSFKSKKLMVDDTK